MSLFESETRLNFRFPGPRTYSISDGNQLHRGFSPEGEVNLYLLVGNLTVLSLIITLCFLVEVVFAGYALRYVCLECEDLWPNDENSASTTPQPEEELEIERENHLKTIRQRIRARQGALIKLFVSGSLNICAIICIVMFYPPPWSLWGVQACLLYAEFASIVPNT